jgi:hypothetical protein
MLEGISTAFDKNAHEMTFCCGCFRDMSVGATIRKGTGDSTIRAAESWLL